MTSLISLNESRKKSIVSGITCKLIADSITRIESQHELKKIDGDILQRRLETQQAVILQAAYLTLGLLAY